MPDGPRGTREPEWPDLPERRPCPSTQIHRRSGWQILRDWLPPAPVCIPNQRTYWPHADAPQGWQGMDTPWPRTRRIQDGLADHCRAVGLLTTGRRRRPPSLPNGWPHTQHRRSWSACRWRLISITRKSIGPAAGRRTNHGIGRPRWSRSRAAIDVGMSGKSRIVLSFINDEARRSQFSGVTCLKWSQLIHAVRDAGDDCLSRFTWH